MSLLERMPANEVQDISIRSGGTHKLSERGRLKPPNSSATVQFFEISALEGVLIITELIVIWDQI